MDEVERLIPQHAKEFSLNHGRIEIIKEIISTLKWIIHAKGNESIKDQISFQGLKYISELRKNLF